MLNEQAVREALEQVIDPEIGINVVDLGMIREVAIDAGAVKIKMVLTAPFCPLAGYLTGQVREVVAAMPEVTEAEVALLDEPWDPSWMKQQG